MHYWTTCHDIYNDDHSIISFQSVHFLIIKEKERKGRIEMGMKGGCNWTLFLTSMAKPICYKIHFQQQKYRNRIFLAKAICNTKEKTHPNWIASTIPTQIAPTMATFLIKQNTSKTKINKTQNISRVCVFRRVSVER